jgi:hypothetical protein
MLEFDISVLDWSLEQVRLAYCHHNLQNSKTAVIRLYTSPEFQATAPIRALLLQLPE